MLQERLWALHWLPFQSIHVLPSQRQKPSPGRAGVQGQLLLRVRCAAATGSSVQLWGDKSEIRRSPGCPRAVPAGGCNKSCSPAAAAPACPVPTLLQPAPASPALPRPREADPGLAIPTTTGHAPAMTPLGRQPQTSPGPQRSTAFQLGRNGITSWGGGLAPVCPSPPLVNRAGHTKCREDAMNF